MSVFAFSRVVRVKVVESILAKESGSLCSEVSQWRCSAFELMVNCLFYFFALLVSMTMLSLDNLSLLSLIITFIEFLC